MDFITLWQPWASLIAYGLKEYETRHWGTRRRGAIAIHAAKRPIDAEGRAVIAQVRGTFGNEFFPREHELPMGAVVAVAELKDCLTMASHPIVDSLNCIAIEQVSELEKAVGYWQVDRFAWKLEQVRKLEPIPWKGAQGLRQAPPELVALIDAQKTCSAA